MSSPMRNALPVEHALRHPDPQVRLAAVQAALPAGRPEESLPALIDLSGDADSRVRIAALRAIAQVGPAAKELAAKPLVNSLRRVWCQTVDEQETTEVLEAMSHTRPDTDDAVWALLERSTYCSNGRVYGILEQTLGAAGLIERFGNWLNDSKWLGDHDRLRGLLALLLFFSWNKEWPELQSAVTDFLRLPATVDSLIHVMSSQEDWWTPVELLLRGFPELERVLRPFECATTVTASDDLASLDTTVSQHALRGCFQSWLADDRWIARGNSTRLLWALLLYVVRRRVYPARLQWPEIQRYKDDMKGPPGLESPPRQNRSLVLDEEDWEKLVCAHWSMDAQSDWNTAAYWPILKPPRCQTRIEIWSDYHTYDSYYCAPIKWRCLLKPSEVRTRLFWGCASRFWTPHEWIAAYPAVLRASDHLYNLQKEYHHAHNYALGVFNGNEPYLNRLGTLPELPKRTRDDSRRLLVTIAGQLVTKDAYERRHHGLAGDWHDGPRSIALYLIAQLGPSAAPLAPRVKALLVPKGSLVFSPADYSFAVPWCISQIYQSPLLAHLYVAHGPGTVGKDEAVEFLLGNDRVLAALWRSANSFRAALASYPEELIEDFLDLHCASRVFSGKIPRFTNEGSFFKHTIVSFQNHWCDELRKQSCRPKFVGEVDLDQLPGECHGKSYWQHDPTSAEVERRDGIEALLRAIEDLPCDLERVVKLHLKGLSKVQIAERIGVSDAAVGRRLRKAMELLRHHPLLYQF